MAKVLVIDDSMFHRSMVVKLISELGLGADQVSSGDEGLAKIREETYDCILCDLLMPGMTGLEVLAALKDEGITVPVVILTADIQQKRKEQCIELGAADFLSKPVNKKTIKDSISKLIK